MAKKAIRAARRVGALTGAVAAAITPAAGWSGGSASAAPPKPYGLTGINATFGTITYVTSASSCAAQAPQVDDWAVDWKHANWTNNNAPAETRYFHGLLSTEVSVAKYLVESHDIFQNLTYYGIGGLDCRLKKPCNCGISGHSWGATVDTNTARNPQGQSFWNGVGSDNVDYGLTLPNIWKSTSPYINYSWGIHFTSPAPDPHHFQYFDGY